MADEAGLPDKGELPDGDGLPDEVWAPDRSVRPVGLSDEVFL